MKYDPTGDWGLKDLIKHLGEPNDDNDGHYVFKCGCKGELLGMSGDTALYPCSAEHAALKPAWTN